MTESDYIILFKEAIIMNDNAIKHHIDLDNFDLDTCEFSFHYQVDTRIDRDDDEIVKSIKETLNNEYYVRLEHVDTFPNAYAAYRIEFEKK